MGRVNLNQAKVIVEAHRQAGPLIRRTSNLIVRAARRMAPRGNHRSGSGVRKPGVQLAQSMQIETRTTVYSIVERVGSTKSYAASKHQGSSPHFIRGHGRMLRFEWERGNLLLAARSTGRLRGRGPSSRLRRKGNFFLFVSVYHPGDKRPVRFLTTPMHLYGRMMGFRTTSTPASRSRLP
jgi:hypothetical protein